MVAVFLFALSTSYALSFALMIVFGLAAVLTQAYNNTTLQLSAPDRIRGRVMGAYSFGTQGLRVVNGPLLGALALAFTTPVAVAGSAIAVLLGLGAIVARFPELLRPPKER
jgi:MFS family permease